MKFPARLAMLFLLPGWLALSPGPARPDAVPLDVVFTLDLSGSTNGLVDDVRDNLWDLINQVSTYRPEVALRIGVVVFSRPSFGRENGYVKILCPLTDNFEIPAGELARLKPSIEKGDQYVGIALKTAVLGMKWAENENAIRVIFLAGNGMVNQDGYRYREAYEEAARRGIVVNTVYCFSSNYRKEIFRWKEIAKYTGGTQYEIRVHHRNPLILSCTDEARVEELADRLDGTYIWYGRDGQEAHLNMWRIDRTAREANAQAFQSRLFYKLSGRFQSTQQAWDLVDYVKHTNSDFRELDFEYLPDTLRGYTPERLKKLVMEKKDERLRVVSQLRGLLRFDRQSYINRQVREAGYDEHPNTMDRIVIGWIDAAAEKKGIASTAK